jgi:hypothetical protein
MIWSNGVVSRRTVVCAVLCVSVVLSLTPAFAQTGGTGSISGQITDQTGAVVPGATVTMINPATKSARTTVSNEAGRYVFVNVDPAVYAVSVNAKGFAQAKLPSVKVAVGDTVNANLTLQVGTATETVEVQATGEQLQTTNATIGSSMTFDMAQSLPGLSRDVSGLALLQPATAPVSGTAGVAGATAGSNADQNVFLLDGGNNSADMDGTNTVYLNGFAGNPITGGGGATPNGAVPTPIESIEEFKVGVAGQGADFNAAAGNQVSMATRRGTNALHGSAYEYYYGTNFSANDWANGHAPSKDSSGNLRNFTKLPSRHQNRFGASLGGKVLPWRILGGDTYLFGFYQGVRFPNITTLEKPMPSDLLRAGVIQVQNDSSSPITLNGVAYPKGSWMPYNLNPSAVTVNGVTYPSAKVCGPSGNLACDPRGIGLNPIVNTIWSKYMPKGNDPACAVSSTNCDQFNTIGYSASIGLPQNDNNWVFRLDHDFGSRNHFMASYRYYKLGVASTGQTDIGGILGGQLGQWKSTRSIPSYPSYLVAGLTSTLSSHMTNDFRYSYTYNWWEWNTVGAPAQPIPGLGGAVEIGGEAYRSLIPYNVDTQDVRTRFWDGQDHNFRDDVTWLKGNHLVTFGFNYQRNFNWHDRNDNGQGVMAANVYQVGNIAGSVNWASILPPTSVLPSGQQPNWESWYAQALGLVTQPQTMYTREGADLHLLPLGTHAQDKSVIPFYQGYISDSWHIKPTLSLTYGLSYTLEMPPFEQGGKQVMLVDQGDNPIVFQDYMSQRKAAALKGQVYNPVIGFATVKNVGQGRKYPYDPFYGGMSPRLSMAWNPHFNDGWMKSIFGDGNTVIRGGYSRIYGRLNGVDLVLVPLLGTGLMQGVACVGAVNAAGAVNGNQCLGSGGATAATAFRIGTDGLVAPLGGAPSATLPQPFFPGVGGSLAAAPGSVLDPKFRPNSNDSFTFSVQRELSSKIFFETGYIGKLIHNEFQAIDTDAVPYMTTLGGQTFAKAFANVYTALCGLNAQVCPSQAVSPVTPQPFFEAAMGGPASAYCTGFSSCTAAVVSKLGSSFKSTAAYDVWAGLTNQSSWVLGRTMYSQQPAGGCPATPGPTTVCRQAQSVQFNVSNGYGNYHALYGSVTFRDFHGFTARSNLTWGRALGTGSEVQARSTRSVLDPFNVAANYGPQAFDVKLVYNVALSYNPKFFKSQQGILGHLLGGWSFAPLFTAQSGYPLRVLQQEGSCNTCQGFGASAPGSTTAIYNAALINGKFNGGNSIHYLTSSPAGTVGTTATSKAPNGTSTEWLNMFGDPAAAYGQFRRLVLGIDSNGGGFGIVRGFPRWNLDGTLAKEIKITERVGTTFTTQFTNMLNHFQPDDPSMNLNSPATFGRVSGIASGYDARQIEFGLRFHF